MFVMFENFWKNRDFYGFIDSINGRPAEGAVRLRVDKEQDTCEYHVKQSFNCGNVLKLKYKLE